MFQSFVHGALALLAAAAQPAPAGAAEGLNAAEQEAVAFALSRGAELHVLDEAAGAASNDMQTAFDDWRGAGLRGYILEHVGERIAVTFYGGPDRTPRAFYRALVDGREIVSRTVYPADTRPLLTPFQRRLAAARAVRERTRHRPCGDHPFNALVIPPPAPDGIIEVYLLTPVAERGMLPLGGHHRVTLGANGRVARERAFTNSCLTMDGPTDDAEALVVTHLLDKVPTEIHVLTARRAGKPVLVATSDPDRIFAVEGERIRLLDDALDGGARPAETPSE